MVSLGLGFLLGLGLGSLALCLAYRSVTKRSFWGRSYCESCHKTLSGYDLFPVFSYIFSHGRCRYCRKKLSPKYPLAEIFTGVLIGILFYLKLSDSFIINALSSPLNLSSLLLLLKVFFEAFVITVFVVVFITDLKTGLIPDRITFPAIKITLIYLIFFLLLQFLATYLNLKSSLLGQYLLPPHTDYLYTLFYRHLEDFGYHIISGIGLGLFFALLIILTRGRGMGGGDFKLSIFLGLALGFPGSLVALLLSFFSGSIFGILLLLLRFKNLGQTIPFGPFLSLGAILALFWGDKLWKWYIQTLSLRGSVF